MKSLSARVSLLTFAPILHLPYVVGRSFLQSSLSLLVFLNAVLMSTTTEVRASTLTEDFVSRSRLDDSGGAVWNHVLGEIHPPLLASGWDDGSAPGGPYSVGFSVGDGQHGAFNSSTYHLFDSDRVVVGNIIEIDTDEFNDLQFTVFQLDAAYTLRPVGTQPLVIRSLSDVIVNGTIDCAGEDGDDATSDPAAVVQGGSGRCGGGDGGDSVAAGVGPGPANNGVSGGAGVTGGGGGPLGLPSGGQGGGGGGSFIMYNAVITDKDDPTDGDDSLGGVGGTVGNNFRDDAFDDDIDGAGSGGGGGSAFDDVGDPTKHSSGAGGGSGGGNIRIYAARDITVKAAVTDVGIVTVDGGDGGLVAGGLKGGGGGGGGGGSVLMFAGRDIVLNGPVTAAAGAGGTTAGGNGGRGAWGRTWIIEKDGFASGLVIEDPESRLDVPGETRFETGTYTVTSIAYDFDSTEPTLTDASLSVVDSGSLVPVTIGGPAGSVTAFDLAFSDTSSLASLSGFDLAANYFDKVVKRYARLQITFTNADGVTPARILGMSFTFDKGTEKEFEFVTGCGGVQNVGSGLLASALNSPKIKNHARSTNSFYFQLIMLMIFFMPLLTVFVLRFRRV